MRLVEKKFKVIDILLFNDVFILSIKLQRLINYFPSSQNANVTFYVALVASRNKFWVKKRGPLTEYLVASSVVNIAKGYSVFCNSVASGQKSFPSFDLKQ
jgi:hypothetical protein